jgi:hypothetical protein
LDVRIYFRRAVRYLSPLFIAHEALAEMDDPQIELLLLRGNFSACKVNHLCRTVPAHQFGPFANSQDAAFRGCPATVLQSAVTDPAWDQAGLPLARGGLGLAHASDLSAAASLGFLQGAAGTIASVTVR